MNDDAEAVASLAWTVMPFVNLGATTVLFVHGGLDIEVAFVYWPALMLNVFGVVAFFMGADPRGRSA